ncbi:hypothetical protein BN1723_016498, partial [Verticillium longisporum]
TANGRDSSSNPSYYVFNNCNIAAASGNSVSAGAYYLGRPWGAYSRVVFQKTTISSVINSAGWSVWNTGDEMTSNVAYGEYQNTGAGASGTRASFSKALSSAVSISTILTSSYASKGPSGAEMLASHKLAQEIIARNNDPEPVLDFEELNLLEHYVKDPSRAKEILNSKGYADEA